MEKGGYTLLYSSDTLTVNKVMGFNSNYCKLQTLAAQAWADGRLMHCEIKFLQDLAREWKLPRQAWWDWLSHPTPLPPQQYIKDFVREPADQLELLSLMEQLAEIDGVVSPQEMQLLARVARAFDLPVPKFKPTAA